MSLLIVIVSVKLLIEIFLVRLLIVIVSVKLLIVIALVSLLIVIVWVRLLIVPRLFEEKWRDTVFGFPWGVARGAWCVVPSF